MTTEERNSHKHGGLVVRVVEQGGQQYVALTDASGNVHFRIGEELATKIGDAARDIRISRKPKIWRGQRM